MQAFDVIVVGSGAAGIDRTAGEARFLSTNGGALATGRTTSGRWLRTAPEVLADADPSPYPGWVDGSTAADRRRGSRTLVIPIASAALLLLVIDLSIALRSQRDANASATLAAAAIGFFAGPISSDSCRSSDNRLDRTAMQVLLSNP